MRLDNFAGLATLAKGNPALASTSSIYHGLMLDMANTSWLSNVGTSAIGFGAIGGVVGGFSDNSTFMGGAAEGAAWGVGKGVATKVLGQHYAAGAVANNTAKVVQKDASKIYSSIANDKGVFPGFDAGLFKSGWSNRQSMFGVGPEAFNSAFRRGTTARD